MSGLLKSKPARVVGSTQTVVLNVPSTYATVQAALTAIADWMIHGTVQIQVANGTYNLASSVNLNHPFGAHVQIIGNTASPSSVQFVGPNPPTFDGFVCSAGSTFGLIDGITINLAAKAAAANNFTAILANQGSKIYLGQHVFTNNWYYGIAAREGSYILADYSTVSNAGDVGIWAMAGSMIDANFTTVSGCIDAANSLGFGIQAEYGSVVNCGSASVTTCNIAGIAALSNSQVRALGATSSGNTGQGFFARDNGEIQCDGSTANSNGGYGVQEYTSGRIFYSSLTATGNTSGVKAGVAEIDNTTLGARIVSTAGALRVDTTDTSSVYFNTQGGLQAEVRSTPSAVNRPVLTGGATGHAVELLADGSDSVIDLAILPKGAGSYVQLGAGYVAGAVTQAGYVTIRDNTGTLRRLLVG